MKSIYNCDTCKYSHTGCSNKQCDLCDYDSPRSKGGWEPKHCDILIERLNIFIDKYAD